MQLKEVVDIILDLCIYINTLSINPRYHGDIQNSETLDSAEANKIDE